MHFLVCGGAGYIGSHMSRQLVEQGHAVTVFDNLSTGHPELARWGELVVGDLLDRLALDQLFAARRFDAVFHFAARSLVGESVQKPDLYYRNNLVGTLNLLDAMRAAGVARLVFSSTAAIYGVPQAERLTELHPQRPINPYGHSKRMVEQVLSDYANLGIASVSLRYFNAAGADPEGRTGEWHVPESHLIPNALAAAAGGAPLTLFGDDYPTPDGTCIRDYVHVDDLCDAHLKALAYLEGRPGAHAFNLGNGTGCSVLEVVRAVERVTGLPVPRQIAPRRAGDPPVLVADCARARERLEWRPAYTDIEGIVATAWRWQQVRAELAG